MLPESDSRQRFTLSKGERLRSQKDIKLILQQNNPFFAYPFKCYWGMQPQNEASWHRIAMAVPKHLFKRAVDRNRIKRLIREAYRQNKAILYEGSTSQKADMLFVCVCKEHPSYFIVTQGIKNILQQIAIKLS
jgi:ribonuclease P protein component